MFALVQLLIQAVEKINGGGTVLRVGAGDTAADRRRNSAAAKLKCFLLNLLPNPLCDFPGVFQVGIRQYHQKFVAAVPRDPVAFALDIAFQNPRYLLQHAVAHAVAVGIVDLFEIINVDQDRGKNAAVQNNGI